MWEYETENSSWWSAIKLQNTLQDSLQRILRNIKHLGRYYPIFLGLTAYWYDVKCLEYKRSWLSHLVMLLSNLTGTVLTNFILAGYIELFGKVPYVNPVMKWVSYVSPISRSVLGAFTVGHILLHDQAIVQLKMLLLAAERKCLERLKYACPALEKRFKYLYWLKTFLLLYMYLTTYVLGLCILPGNMGIMKFVLAFLYGNFLSQWSFVFFEYFELLWKLCSLLYQIEEGLSDVIRRVKLENNEPQACSTMSWLLMRHSELCGLLLKFEQNFKWQLFVSRLSNMASYSITTYFVFVFNKTIYDSMIFVGVAFLSYLLLTLDSFLIDYICDVTAQSFDDLELALKDFNGIYREWKIFDQLCEEFSLHICHRKLYLKLAGALNLDRKSWFYMMSNLLMYSIVLIQTHLSTSLKR
uniref:Gustatory receptor n=1 Tax=Stomoxys calcitrans TaxID=35570 RepID=A0A1I8Q9Z8_STOCA